MSTPELPAILFDGFAVLQALPPVRRARTSPENVGDVLDAVVAILRATPRAAPLVAPEGWQLVPKTLTPAMRDALLTCESGEFSVQGGWDYILAASPLPKEPQ